MVFPPVSPCGLVSMQENSQCSINANIRTRSLNCKHMEFIYHWKKIEGKKKKHSDFERNQELALNGSGTSGAEPQRSHTGTGTNALLSQAKECITPIPRTRGVPMIQIILRLPLTSPGTFLVSNTMPHSPWAAIQSYTSQIPEHWHKPRQLFSSDMSRS